MIRDITLGQYYPGDSIVHRLDPRVKIVGTFFFIVSVFLFDNLWGIGLATFFLLTYILTSQIPTSFIFKGLRPILIIMLITALFNLFLTPGKVLWSV